jgi:transposase-like protein
MNPQNEFCPNLDCPARGQQGKGNVSVHSEQEGRYICHECQQTFSASKGTLFYRLRTDATTVLLVITLMAYGCPLPAIVKAFGFDERTVKAWWQRAGAHCESFHHQRVRSKPLDLQQVQADEVKAKLQGGACWMAMALMVPTRLWLAGVVAVQRDATLISQLVAQIVCMALCRPLLLAVDGLAAYVGAFQAGFRSKLPRFGQPGRAKWVAWPDIAIVQVIKRRLEEGLSIERRIVQGSAEMVERLRQTTQGAPGVINTAYIERLNATFRQRLAGLTRRTRCLAHQTATLNAGMYIVGCFYNFCDEHDSLRLRLWLNERRHRWVQRTPAMAAALTDHCWTPAALFCCKVPPPPWTPPKRRGRPSHPTLLLVQRWCS